MQRHGAPGAKLDDGRADHRQVAGLALEQAGEMRTDLGRNAQRLAELAAHAAQPQTVVEADRLEPGRQLRALRQGRRTRGQVRRDHGVDAPARQFARGEPDALHRGAVGHGVAKPVQRVRALALALADADADGRAGTRQGGAVERDAQRAHQERADGVGGERDGRILERRPRRRRDGGFGERGRRAQEEQRVQPGRRADLHGLKGLRNRSCGSGASACVRCGRVHPGDTSIVQHFVAE